ncbi:peptidase S53 [Bacillus cereus]|uniref:S53 family peptidase n=1 Tax=Bacillus cereus TaxID=1396 RepID=UPI000BEDC0B4|nr:S53 family peptidase [Bacillus cereus]PED02866.1 peptidase S53 [Bacillus cereus]PER67540.1 peptidase S53 [Bacillus cereus]
MKKNLVRVPGSERDVPSNAKEVTPADPNEKMLVTIVVRRPSNTETLNSMIEKTTSGLLSERGHLTGEEFASNQGANPNDVKKVEEFAKEQGLEVKDINIAVGTVVLAGTVNKFSTAFGVELAHYEHPDFTYRGRTGHVHVPEELADIVEAVLGLDNRPQVSPHICMLEEDGVVSAAAIKTFTPPEVAKLYNFPTLNCKDQCIAIIEFGGGYKTSDMVQYFNRLGVSQPKLVDVLVDGAHNQTGDAADSEVQLDIEIAAAVAPGVRIAMYFAPNTDVGFLHAVNKAIHDQINKPSVISISWGAAENSWTEQAREVLNRAFQDAATLGITICCASGDNGSSDYSHIGPVPDQLLHTDFPASSPFVLACGGTRLEGTDHTITNEVVWNNSPRWPMATGGGVSDVFSLPSWQINANVPSSANPGGQVRRGVPDVAGNADPETGYQIEVNGQRTVMGGTSAVAPLWAGLIANINQKLGHSVGFINPILYNFSAQNGIFHDITKGNNNITNGNGAYKASSGWDACTGLGSPDGTKLMNALENFHS